MASTRSRSLIVSTLVVLSLGVTARAWTGGFLDGLVEVWGVRYVYEGTPALELLSAPPLSTRVWRRRDRELCLSLE